MLKRYCKIIAFSTFVYVKIYQIKSRNLNIKSGADNEKYLNEIKKMKYNCPLYLINFYCQLIMSEYLKGNNIEELNKVTYDRITIPTHDGHQLISIDFYKNEMEFDKIVLIMHGLTGGSDSTYIKDTMIGLDKLLPKAKLCCVNYRGINKNELLTSKCYHAGFTDDFETSLLKIKSLFPDKNIYLVGFSMGANIITKLISKNDLSNNTKEALLSVKGFVSVSNPSDIVTLEQNNRGKFLDSYLLQRWKKYVSHHKDIFKKDERINVDFIISDQLKSYRDFDSEFTCKIFGFENPEDYYTFSESKDDIFKLPINSLFINAKDDLLSPFEKIFEKFSGQNPKLTFIFTDIGSHCCWYEKNSYFKFKYERVIFLI